MVAALTTTVDCRFADVQCADPEPFVGSPPAEFGLACELPCGASGGGAAAVATGVSGVAASRTSSDATGSAEGADAAGCSVGAAVAAAEGTPV